MRPPLPLIPELTFVHCDSRCREKCSRSRRRLAVCLQERRNAVISTDSSGQSQLNTFRPTGGIGEKDAEGTKKQLVGPDSRDGYICRYDADADYVRQPIGP